MSSKYPSYLEPILDRMDPAVGRTIDCGPGWFGLISELHQRLVELDPEYRVFQVKQKFGGLRFYFSPSNPDLSAALTSVVLDYERMSFSICERTGLAGEKMTRGGVVKTLHSSFAEEGWTPDF